MAVDQNSQIYPCKVAVDQAQAEYVRQRVQAGDALNLKPDAANPHDPNAIVAYHFNQKIGHINDKWIRHVLKPGREYEAWARNFEYDAANVPTILNIEVMIYGIPESTMPPRSMPNSITPTSVAGAEEHYLPHYHSSPVMFRAHPIWFVIALLLIPAIIGAIILVIWAVQSRTTHLEIDEDTVRYETGVFSKDRRALSRRAIRTVRVTQSLLNRMLDVGAIEIYTAGDVPEIRAVSMYAPNDIRELLGK